MAGLDIVPGAGERFLVLEDVEAAREVAEMRGVRKGRVDKCWPSTGGRRTLEEILNAALEGRNPGFGRHRQGRFARFARSLQE